MNDDNKKKTKRKGTLSLVKKQSKASDQDMRDKNAKNEKELLQK